MKSLAGLAPPFFLGALLALAAALPLYGTRVEQLTLENQRLQLLLRESQEGLARLEESLRSNSWLTVSEIEVVVEHPSPAVRIAVEEGCKQLLAPFRGRSARHLDPVALYHVLHNRQLEVAGESYLLQVRSILVSSRLKAYVTAHPP